MEQQPPIEALNEDITWEELNGVLHQLKTSKCPGMDGLPNEFLRLCRVDLTSSSPESAMGTVLLRTCNSVFSGNISDALNTSLVVSLPKPNKDFTYLSNRRGISLISCVLKLVTKIVANRFQQHAVPGTGGLRKEQAGFRLREECNAQAATLIEIAGRRGAEAKPTYVAFMDLQKAFDMVPHNGMLHILRAKGVSGKCWSFIQRLYTNGTFRVLVGPTTSDLAPLERGVRQGDSLSPLLFNYVMDSCLDNLSGVTVPGMSQRIPGLLLADDAVILANTDTEMRDNLAAFGEWATSWHMKIGHDKCGLMVLHDQPAHSKAKDSVWRTQGSVIPVVDQYTYLGLTIDTEVSTATMAEARAVTGAKTLSHLAPFLAHSSIPVAMKKMVINGILLPQLCYGAEVWADKQCNIPPVQRILNNALRLTTVGRMKNKRAISTHIVHEELDIANISAIATSQRNTKTYLKTSTHRATPVDMHRLLRTRLNAWPGLLYRLSKWHEVCLLPGFECVCPSCDSAPRDDLHHIGMVCPAFQEQREAILRPAIDAITKFFDDHQLQRRSDTVWTACLGGLSTTDAEILQKFQQMWVGTPFPQPARGTAPHVEGTPSQPARESHRYDLRSTSSTDHTNNLSTHVRGTSPPDEMPSVQDTDSDGSSMQAPEDSAMSWLMD
ncbi:LINE-1 retrotransposable element ORF2 protein, partial [Picochlorum sp. SENEW3]